MRMTPQEAEERVVALVDEASEWIAAGGWHPSRVKRFRSKALLVSVLVGLPLDVVIDSALAAARELVDA